MWWGAGVFAGDASLSVGVLQGGVMPCPLYKGSVMAGFRVCSWDSGLQMWGQRCPPIPTPASWQRFRAWHAGKRGGSGPGTEEGGGCLPGIQDRVGRRATHSPGTRCLGREPTKRRVSWFRYVWLFAPNPAVFKRGSPAPAYTSASGGSGCCVTVHRHSLGGGG